MVNARKKWIRYELELVKKYKEAGFKDAKTSRFASKMVDDLWVDIIEVWGFLPQAKNYKRNFGVWQTIDLIKWIKKKFKKWVPVIHIRLTEKRKAVVVLEQDDYFNLLKKLNDSD